ncbi:ATP-binding protein [Castellaniella sp.]|uniref:ATP-binding protein n=1 Tax=Castellaniella sp. TaxID=1955812 RepID=UPI003C70E5E6
MCQTVHYSDDDKETLLKERYTPPSAPTLLDAMRAIGYSFETALADIIDNSIAAAASQVTIEFSAQPSPYVVVGDNGTGMTASRLFDAMRHGSQNPGIEREQADLGRFGLGLKTASLSQCRRLTVVSSRDSIFTGAEWDLDTVARTSNWTLLELESHDLNKVPAIESLRKADHGTLIIWRELDRALAGESNAERALMDLMDRTRDHLALVFHRFLQGTTPILAITINGIPITPIDPYLSNSRGSQTLPEEILHIDGEKVRIEAHILPHISKLTPSEVREAGGEEGLRRNQGFYVYRSRRLITWGTWFRLAKQEEITKLARVIVDIPNSLDHLWSLDVKKSAAHPPEKVRQGLLRIIELITNRSRRVYTFRGNQRQSRGLISVWERIELRDKHVRYQINREHDLFTALTKELPEHTTPLLEQLIRLLEDSFPFDAVYADMASDRRTANNNIGVLEIEDKLTELAIQILAAIGKNQEDRTSLLDRIHLLEPFSKYPDITAKIREKFGEPHT